MIIGAPDVVSSYVIEQLFDEFNWHEEGVKTPVALVLANETVSPWIDPEAPDTFAEQIVDEPTATEAGMHCRVEVEVVVAR